jgi:hypothetical protein
MLVPILGKLDVSVENVDFFGLELDRRDAQQSKTVFELR